ncbi:tol-pal system protein YbgF [Bradyrhizobium prioriisuperbiae]|uniref:tol-pal system protein YbgF n=1 Tax=Bradyrhizobium prioriisuperbiae TaxID=2854389 RepID=UPI0028E73ED6|nr:tol-pal system protein YbgF [Bradyrhizobium prioritasuperba]
MSFKFHTLAATLMVIMAAIALPVHAVAQMSGQMSDDDNDPQRVERLENQIRQLTGQNEELQYRNRQLEEQIRQLQAGQGQPAAPGVAANQPVAQPPQQTYQQPPQQQTYQQQPYPQQTYQPPPPIQQSAAPVRQGGRRNDAFDPNQNPNAPGAPRALGGGQLPIDPNAQVAAPPIGAPGGRGAGEPLDLANTAPGGAAAPGGLTTLPPGATPKDEFDLGIGYIQRKDYALAEETMRNFVQKYPSDRLMADAQYWLGESMFQRQRYRDAAESFLNVTTKFETSAKAPDALLRLGQSLAALKEKEAACAALGEVARKYPRASAGVKQGVDREQKRVKC